MEQLIYDSEFLPDVKIVILTSDNPQYETVSPLFQEYGYGFMVPGKNLIIIDGEILIDEFDANVLKFIEAHEVSHIILGHDGPRNENDEIEADLGAYLLLKKYNKFDSIDYLVDNFEDRHGVEFDESLTKKLEKFF
jgi:hypothetical protein